MMREPIELPRRLWRLMDGHLNGTISDADMEELESLVLNNDMAARTFFDYARLHAELHLLAAAQVSVAKARAKEFGQAAQPQTGTSHPQPSRSRPAASKSPVLGFLHNLLHVGPDTPSAAALSWLVMALCTGIALAALVGIVLVVRGMHVPADAPESQIADHKSEIHLPSPALPPAPSGAVAHLIHTADCRWADEAEAPQVGADLRAGRKLALKSGLVEILFESGARTVLEGPATLEVSSRRSALLRRGKLTATVEDPSARGFAICTAGMKFTDLGTEFGVLVKQDGMQEVHVFRGKVQADRDADAERPVSPLVLTVNQAIRITGRNTPFERIASDEKRFVRTEQMSRIVARQSQQSFARPGRKVLLDPTQVGAEMRLKPRSPQTTVAASRDATAPGFVVTIRPGGGDCHGVEFMPEGAAAWDLSAFGHVEARVVNTSLKPLTIYLRVENGGDWHKEPKNHEAVTLPPGAAATVKTIFGYAYGVRDFPLDPAAVTKIVVFVERLSEPQSFRIESVWAGGPAGEKPAPRG